MLRLTTRRDFARWRSLARGLLADGVSPGDVLWANGDDEASLWGGFAESPTDASPDDGGAAARGDETKPPAADPAIAVPRSFLTLAATVACHRDPDRWNLLYRSLYRIARGGERALLDLATDDDTLRLHAMERAVRRDRHKMTAFVRFKAVASAGDVAGDDDPQYVAWHRPDHYIVRLTAPFFAARFATLHWTILTPDDSATWDGSTLSFGPGVPESEAPAGDDLEGLWRTYYANIFNPARVKIRAMKRELPVRHWPTLPEAQLIPDLLHDAPRRVREMAKKARDAARPGTGPSRRGGGATDDRDVAAKSVPDAEAGVPDAGPEPATRKKANADAGEAPPKSPVRGHPAGWGAEPFLPESRSLPVLAKAAKACRGCDLCEIGTQTVFGEGRPDARVVFIGEQPGDQEDHAGRPFIGPAGQLLNEVLEQVGIDRDDCYVTNTVKHFKWEPRGKRRIHAKANAREIAACRPWLEAELEIVKPKILVCLGATAAQAIFGREFRVTESRGRPIESEWAPWAMATIHPSALLRIPDPDLRERSRGQFEEDLRLVAKQIATLGK